MAPTLAERLEIRVDSETLERIDAWRAGAPGVPSRGESVRQLIERGLQQRPREIRPSDGEKIIIQLLVQMMEKVGVEKLDVESAQFVIKAIQGGHYWAPHWEWVGLLHDHADDPADVKFVVDVLDMWSFIEDSYKAFSAPQKKAFAAEALWNKSPEFSGFDGNHEGELRSIARFLVDEMKRFTQFSKRTLNSHTRKREQYQHMLAVFEPIRARLDGRGMTPSELASVINAIAKKAL